MHNELLNTAKASNKCSHPRAKTLAGWAFVVGTILLLVNMAINAAL